MPADVYQRAIPAAEESHSLQNPTNDIEKTLQAVWAHVLNLSEQQVALDRPFLSLGGDSISAMQVMGQCRKKGLGLGVQDILRSRSIPQLATTVKQVQTSMHNAVEEVDKPFNLTPIQSLWFQLPNQGYGHFNQSFYLKVNRKTTAQEFHAAVEKLISRHSMLRARFSYSTEGGWQQRVTENVADSYRFRHQSVSTKEAIDTMIEDSQACLNHSTGPLLAADLFEYGNEQHAFLVAHHLVIDLVTWRLLLEELEEILKGETLLPPALSFQTWAHLQSEHAETLKLDKVLPPVEIPALDLSYWGIQHADNTYGNAGHASFELDPSLTALFLGDCHKAMNTEPVEVLLASLIQSWSQIFTDRPVPAIFNEGHGREPWNPDIDITRTVGWFTTLYPVFVEPSDDSIETVCKVKDFRRRIPANGRPYFAQRLLTAEGRDHFTTHWPMEISFNYLGQYQQLERSDALLQPLESMAGETREAGGTADVGHKAPRFGLFEISAIVFKGRLKFAFTFNRHMQHQDRIQQWVSACYHSLTDMTQKLPSLSPTPTLSDFPLLSLDEERFRFMLHRLSKLGIATSNIESAYPTSNMQEGLLLSQTKDAGFYAAVTVHELKLAHGHPNWEQLAEGWRQVVKRHAALRTIFLENIGTEEGLYDQVVLKQVEPNIGHFKCESEQDALQIFENQRSINYDNGRGPPHRFSICSTSAGRVFCCLEIAHSIMDGHSMSVIFKDLQQAYQGRLREDGPAYRGYISYLMNQPQDVSLGFWKSYLQGSEVCSFPVLNDGKLVEKQLNNIRVDFGSLSILDLQSFCSSHGITLSNVFHTAWALTLSRYIGSNDVTFGYLTSARDSQDVHRVDEMVGPIINTLVCRVNLCDGARCLLDILRDVQNDYMDVQKDYRRHIALAEVQHVLDLSGTNLFNTALSYRRLPSEAPSVDVGVKFEEIAPIYDPTEYPVSINIEVSDDAAMVDLDYWTDHLSPGQATNVAGAFVRALENIVHHPNIAISTLDHLSGRHWQQIQDWNVMPETLNECVHHRFASWIESQPDAPAIRGFDGDYTYAELDAVTNRLAHHLVELGIGPEVFVPTCFDKSSFAVVAMLAVLKAGGAAVPLDANHPKPVLESRIEDTQAQVVLTTSARSEMFEDVVPDVVIVDSVLLEDLEDVDGPACTAVAPHNPSFVIFTSGSTGRPKGVVLEHTAMVTSANAHGTNLGIGPGTRFLQFASYTFDNSLEEMFTTLQRGGCVCIPSEDGRFNNLAGAITELNANFMDLTPTVAALLNPADVPSIKGMALGGEALTKAVVEQWSKYVHLHGQYGPSEASINSAWKDFKHGGEPTNIGRAIGSVSWVVDPENRNRLVPIGCKGELLIEGPILSRGYLNDPEKTRLAFIDAPEWARTGDTARHRRFYCTGDLVHYTSEGEMMYLGRKDSQVKLNGQRIELGEIEHHLKLNLPADAQSAVELVQFTDSKGTKALVGFLCLPDEPMESANDCSSAIGEMSDAVRAVAKSMEVALANALPAYYVPSLFMPVTSMPMTTSGKLDRKILRLLAQSVDVQLYRLAGKSGRAPSGNVEITLARLWSDVLNLAADAVGAEDSFFRLGGDSIGAMRLVTVSRKEGIVLNVANIFAQPKLVDMAATAVVLSSEELTAAPEPDTTPFELIPEDARRRMIDFAAAECGVYPDSIEDIYPCSRLQEGLIALSTKEPGAYVAEAIYRLPPDTDITRFKQAWNRVIAAEAILRTRILYTEDCGFVQVVVRDQVEWHNLTDVRDINETHRHLPAKHGGVLTTYAIVGEGSSSPYFAFTAHHAVYDGWSLPNLLCKVESCYQTSQDSLGSVPYSRFVKYLSTIDEKKSNEFWLSTFDNITAPQFPQLPNPDYNVQASSQVLHRVSISRRSGMDITMPSMIRAAWGLLLATYSGSDDVLWGETNSGREVPVPGIEDIIGATIATSPMRLRLDRQLTIEGYLHEVQRQASAALPYQFAGLQHIRKLSSDTAVACDFQSLLAIVAGDSMKDPEGGLWDLQSTGTIGTNFFNYAFIFNCAVEKDGIHIEAHYDSQVIQPWLVQRLLQQFDFILSRLNDVRLANQPLSEFDLLNVADRDVIAGWNSRPVNIISKCIHNAIFQDQVILRPSALAIDAWDTGSMSYRELDERATRLASQLISLGVKPQTFIPLCFDKSGWTIVSILAVMKAGAAFVPLDFEAPIARLREIVGDVKAELILCSPQYEQLCQSIPCKTLVASRHATERQPGRLYTLPYVQSDTPAYAIFTSGSTGKPKGAVIDHCSWVSSSTVFAPLFGISETSRVLQFASYTFDACLIEILSTLMLGGTICIPDQASRTNDLAGVINDYNINWATLTPSVVRTMQPSQVPQLKTLILVGEAMSQQDLLTWADRVRLGNGYGPTECSAIATVNIMTSTTKPNNLGKAVTARGWVVSKDNHDVLAPLGAVGELLLEGGGVGAGYLNNPEKTAQAFIGGVKWTLGADSQEKTRPRRFYKTGDLVKYNEDGTMMYLGRKDSQTKVRGQRLELSEVEHHLIDDPECQNALAAVPSSGPCAKRLVGVVSLQNVALQSAPHEDLQLLPKDTASLNISAIRDRLCERLPAYMVPSLWVAVRKFPLMPSGKMDRRRVVQWLERMDSKIYRVVSTLGSDAPSGEAAISDTIESKLQAIFAKVLNLPLEDIRPSQSFLHLGGDSIAAMQVSSQCRAQGLAITVQDIIRSKSIAALASTVSVAEDDQSSATKAQDYNLPFDLTPIQRVFFDTAGNTYNHFNQSVVLRLARSFELEEVRAALMSLVEIHPMLRGRYAKDESRIWRQRVEKDTKNSFRLRHHQIRTADEAAIRPIVDETQATLDITAGPTFAVDLFDIYDTFFQAVALVAHHLVIDVVSWGIVLEDLQSLLNGVKPPPQSLPFHTWSVQQTAQAKQDTSRRVLPVAGIPPADLNYWGMSTQSNINADVITEDIELSPKDSMLLLGAHDALATEPLDVFIAALLQAFRKVFPDRATATIHNEGHGREPFNAKQDLSRTVGWFTTLTPIPLPISSKEATDIVSTIRWVKDVRERIPGKGRPYFAYRLLAEEGQERFSGHWPAEVTFNYLGRMQNLERKDALLRRLDGVSSTDVGDDVPRLSLFEVTALVAQGTIKLSFSYNRHMKRQAEIKQWISESRQTLVDAVDQLLQLRPEPSLSDFKLLPLSYNGLSRLNAVLPSGTTIADIEDIYPTSPLQAGILLSQLKHPEFYAYHCIFEVRSTDAGRSVNPRKLAEAWQVVVHRHQALRTVFIESLSKAGLMEQIVFKDRPARIVWMADCDDGDIARFLREQPAADYREFSPPHKFTICKTKSDRVWIKLEMSHAICDGSSIPNILNDLARAYEGKLTRSDAGPLFSDFIAHLLSSSREIDVNYWKAYLSGVEPCFFPTLNDGKSGPHELGAYEVHFSDTANIQAFCKKNGVTLSNVLQLAWALVLHCYVGTSDISFGVVASGRDVPVRNIEEAAGCFVNMLICRLNFSDETPIRHLLEALQTDSVNALSHQSCSLANVQHELQLPSLFNTVFTYQRRQLSRDPEKTALVYESVEAGDPGEYHVTVNADVSDEGATVDFGFWKDKICPAQARYMVETFEKILGDIVASKEEMTIGELDAFTPGSLEQVMEWNSELSPPVRRCLHDFVHDQALLRPRSAKAVEGWDGTFTYQEFDEITNQLALHLQTMGVSTEAFVPIMFEKSSWAIVAMIAIMKAGGAYVPLDPKHPPGRLRSLIGDVGANVVLCSRNYHPKAAEVATTALIVDKQSMKSLPPSIGLRPKSSVTPDNAAYCLFTSGTTGTPKGTIIPHQAICTSATAFTKLMHMDSTSRTFQFASYTFDASCAEILAALIVGATICVPTEDERLTDPAGAISRFRATWTFMTPSVLGTMKPERVPCLKTLVAGGEAVPGPVITKWGNSTCLMNGYGPTETTVFAVTCHKSTLDKKLVDFDPGTIGIASGCRLWIVHPRNHDRLMPIGSVGELVIEGYTAARGYLGDEVKTAKVFIANPAWASALSSDDGAEFFTTRMYKSGDLVRYNSDGSISYIGRKDTQVKLNGQRIELGEIEFHVKSKFPEAVQSAVDLVAPASRSAAKALAVFFSIDEDRRAISAEPVQPTSSEVPVADELLLPIDEDLRDMCKSVENALGGVLPGYMIPAIFFPVKKMPWTTAGKLDRNRLCNLVQNLGKEDLAPYRLSSAMNKRKPTTEVEKKLQKLVCSVLNLPTAAVGLDDSFIRLGGDSIAAMRFVTAALSEHLELSVIDIFQTPRLSDLAAKCAIVDRGAKPDSVIEPFSLLRQPQSQVLDELADQCRVSKDKIQDAYPISALQEAFIALSTKQRGAYVAQHVLALAESVDLKKFKAAWEKAVQDTDLLRTRIVQLQSGTFLQTVLVEDPISWRETATLEEAEDEATSVPEHPGGKLAAYTIVRTASSERYFSWTLHHSLYDGWSIPFMLQRVQQIYQTGLSEIAKTPYTKFIKYLLDTNREVSSRYWKDSLAGAAPYQFPQQSRSTSGTSPNGQTLQHTAKIAPHCHSEITPSTVIRAAWALLLATYTGSDDVVFGETLTGRDIAVAGITEICGPTLTTLPTRVKVSRGSTVLDLLRSIAKSVTDRIPHQHFGLSEIKRIDQDSAAACDFQNLLAIQTDGEQPSELMWSFHTNGIQTNYFTYPLVVECKAGRSSVEISAHYDANVMSSWEVQRILYQLESVLAQLSSVGHVRDVHVFSEQDKQLLREWNRREPVAVDETIPSLFYKQATLRPHATAVSAFDGDFTYAELRDLASRLAQELIKLGTGPEKLIPLCVDKSRWAVVAIIAVLLSGAAYVPLSPEHPAPRHRQIIEECNASTILCSPEYESRFTSSVNKVITISETSIRQLPPRQSHIPLRAKGNNACYVLYTSGSTGVPKGVVIEHQAIASSSAAICKALHLKSSSRVFQFGSFVFDASVMEILTTLTQGAAVCIPSEQERTADIATAINKLKATWTCLTPSVANVIESPADVPTLKTFASGAEALTPETINKWSSGLELLNAYGPTEASVVAVANDQVAVQRDSSIIGRVLESGRAWLTNPDNPSQLAPIGAAAELCVEGPLLARGYLNNRAKTAESFVENPAFLKEFSDAVQTRIYRTGDLVQYAQDGSLRYIGRKDNQVKLAGQRMELGDIEHHLQADKSIRQAIVQMPKTGPGKRKLTAVVSFRNVTADSDPAHGPWNTPLGHPDILRQINDVRNRLTDLVPSYMVPSVIVAIADIPTLASLKLDRKQVGAWLEGLDDDTYRQILELESSSDSSVPVTEVTKTLQGIWAKVLNVPVGNVKPNKSWLALGGDSITAMQLLARCRKEGFNLTLNQVLRSRSLAHLADSVGSISGFDHGAEQTERPFELSPIQQFYFKSIGDDQDAHFNQSFTLRLSQRVDPVAVQNAIDAIVRCHSMLRARFICARTKEWQQIIASHSNGSYKFEVHNLSESTSIVNFISDAQKSLDIVDGPTFAVNLFNLLTGEQVLFITAHHLVIDVVSWRIVLGDLEDCLKSGSCDSLQKELPFQVWTEKQAKHALQSTQIKAIQKQIYHVEPADLAFWGMDKRRNIYNDVDRDSFSIEGDISAMALNDHQALRTDVVDLFVAAIVHSFSRIFINRKIPTVFNETHGREPWESSNLDLSRTVGWFTTMYPVHVPIAEDKDDVVQTVRQVKDIRRKVTDNGRPYFAHRYLTEDGKQRFAQHEPMEILFNYLGKMQQLESDDSLFQPMQFDEDAEAAMSDLGAKTGRPALFEISASVARGKIQFNFMYNRLMKNQKGIRRWIAECQRTLEEIVSDLGKIELPQPTLSDFPLLPLESYERLDRVTKSLPTAGILSYSQVESMYPTAAMQEGMILSQIRDPESYWSFSTFEVKTKRGKVDIRRIADAWKRVADRHPALRTVFVDSVCKGGVFDQIVITQPDTGLLTYTCDDSELAKKLDSIKYSKLNGKKKPRLPHQFAIVQTTSGRVIVKMEINHAVIDGGSHAVIRRDLEDAYEGRLSADEGPLYSDYIKYLRGLPADAAIKYWREQLRGVEPCYFPIIPQHSSKQRQLHSLYMDFDRFPEVQALAKRGNVTFANILLAAWALLLRTYTGSSDICYGYLTSGRNIPMDNIQHAVGAFINMLVSRIKVSRSLSLLDISQKVQSDFIESLPHQHCSLAQFQHDLGLSGKALFNTAVSVQNHGAAEGQPLSNSNVEFEPLDAHDPSEFAITVNIDATPDDEGVRFSYWTDSVSDDEAKNMSSILAKILAQALTDANQTVAELDAAIEEKPEVIMTPLRTPTTRSLMPSPRSDGPESMASLRSIPKIEVPQLAPTTPPGVPDWSHLIRSIVSEMVPQIVDQVLAKNKNAPAPAQSTVNEMTNQMAGMLARRASHSIRGRPNLETGSIRSRRLSAASDAGSRINIAADMVAAAGVMATEALKSAPPNFVEKKLLTLWSELLDMVEGSIEKDDSFFQLGGDSIIAMRLVGAAREEGLSMTVADVFKNPTFADMSRVVRVAGEVIDQVMSQAGGESSSNPKIQLTERTASLWKDFQSIASEHAIGDGDTDGVITPPAKAEHDKGEHMFQKWEGFGSAAPATQQPPPRMPSQKRRMPTTILEDPSTTKSISLLGDPNVDSVISKVQVFKGGISDVLPVTDFQSLAITGTLLESKWMLNYFYLDGEGPLDLRKLKQTTFRLVQAFDILRTVFVPYGDRFLQVVLRKLQPDFNYQETDTDLDDFTAELRQKDREHGPRLGETFVQFIVAKQKKTGRYRIFLRMSHAQYDGYCLPKILGSLQAGYNGLPISSAPSFGNYVRESARTIAGAHDHWKEVLRGSKMTEIVNRYGPNYQRSAGKTVTLKQLLTVPTLSYVNITAATVMKASWAATLARITSQSDIVFGHVISGRNSAVPNVESIIGPCLNMVPVRVVYRPEWTVLDLLAYIQDQQIANIPYESLGFREITRNCTDWPDWTNFSSVLQHNQNIHSDDATLQLGGIEFKVGAVGSQEDFADFSITSTSRSGDQLEVQLTYAPSSTITTDYAQHVFDMLCANIIAFSEDPYTLLPSPSEFTSRSSTTISSEKARQKSAEKQPLTLPTNTNLSKHELAALATKLRSAWEQILRDEHGAPATVELGSDFFQLGGDIMGLAQVTSILDYEGLRVRVEDLIDKSVFVEQVGVLAVERKKAIEKEEMSPWGEKGRGKKEEKVKEEKGTGFGALARKMKLLKRDTMKAKA
ncbi:acetyl-CoA synthetase-like protein [Lentithecium fluviatile CBS 122367]|uniref:Acetyl-CoA synthetase-like protein n=1 Tax=Lentithecium fluviatile CBS 122367 TaxID=1168545 RepID=A0A6G1IYT0_9PLEO|nr:acetyl-CoA synthetase-like protein [Lentithecium fluviatile CBS 122367]